MDLLADLKNLKPNEKEAILFTVNRFEKVKFNFKDSDPELYSKCCEKKCEILQSFDIISPANIQAVDIEKSFKYINLFISFLEEAIENCDTSTIKRSLDILYFSVARIALVSLITEEKKEYQQYPYIVYFCKNFLYKDIELLDRSDTAVLIKNSQACDPDLEFYLYTAALQASRNAFIHKIKASQIAQKLNRQKEISKDILDVYNSMDGKDAADEELKKISEDILNMYNSMDDKDAANEELKGDIDFIKLSPNAEKAFSIRQSYIYSKKSEERLESYISTANHNEEFFNDCYRRILTVIADWMLPKRKINIQDVPTTDEVLKNYINPFAEFYDSSPLSQVQKSSLFSNDLYYCKFLYAYYMQNFKPSAPESKETTTEPEGTEAPQ